VYVELLTTGTVCVKVVEVAAKKYAAFGVDTLFAYAFVLEETAPVVKDEVEKARSTVVAVAICAITVKPELLAAPVIVPISATLLANCSTVKKLLLVVEPDCPRPLITANPFGFVSVEVKIPKEVLDVAEKVIESA
jgi:hypothetical protein